MSIRRLAFSRKFKGLEPSQLHADAGADISTIDPSTILLDASGSYTDSHPLTYHWAVAWGSGFTIDTPDNMTSTVTWRNKFGTTVVGLSVTDHSGNSATDFVNIEILNDGIADLKFDVDEPNIANYGYIRLVDGVPDSLVRIKCELTDFDYGDEVNILETGANPYSVTLDASNISDVHDYHLNSSGEKLIYFYGKANSILKLTTSILLYDGGDMPDPSVKTVTFLGDGQTIGY